MDEGYKPFLSFTKEELVEFFKEIGLPAYRVNQMRRWVYARKTPRISMMSDLSKETRERLTRLFGRPERATAGQTSLLIRNASRETVAADENDAEDSIYEGRLVAKSISDDGSEKLLIEWRDGRRV